MIDSYILRFLELFHQTTVLQWVLAFVLLVVTDVCWAFYTKATAVSKPLPASCWAVCLFGLGGSAVVGYAANPVLLIPSMVGAFVGTYIGATMSKEKK